MIAAALIVLREVFEAALIVGIVLAATRGVARRTSWIAGGIVAGIIGAVIVAALARQIAAALEGVGQEVFNAGVLLAATTMLAWHNVWMKRHGVHLAREMKTLGSDVISGARSLPMLLIVVALAVLREGAEVVLFLYGIASGGAGAAQLLLGSALGLVAGIAIGWALYRGLLAIPSRHVFGATSLLLLLLAGGMAAQAANQLVQAGVLQVLADPLWDSSAWLPEHALLGQTLHALVGYSERPSGIEIVFFLSVVIVVGAVMMLSGRSAALPRARASSISVLWLSCGLAAASLFVPDAAQAAHVVYSPIVEQGEIALEYRGHRDLDASRGKDGSQQHKLELEYAPVARWKTELLGEWEKEPGTKTRATEIAWENILQLTEQGQHWADVGVLAEYAHSLERGGHDALELGLLAEKQLARSVMTANLLAERAFEPGAKAQLDYALRWRYRLREKFEPGMEVHGEFGEWGAFGSASTHRHQVGPAALGRLHRTDGRGALKYEAAMLFGVTRNSPASTLRLQIEYEF